MVNSSECAAVPVSLKSLNVLDHDIVIFPVDAQRSNHTLLNVYHNPAKVTAELVVSVNLIVDVPSFNVKFVVPATIFKAVEASVRDTILLHRFNTFVLVQLVDKVHIVRLLLFVVNVQFTRLIFHVQLLKVSCRAHAHHAPLKE